jgi:HAE1 family hydrophobic/amphiphilic exporter-1
VSVDFFLKRPVLSSVIALLVIVVGVLSIPSLPVSEYPQLSPPVVSVSTLYVGADAATVETTVTSPLEQALNGVPGMKQMTSTSGNDGTCSIAITFNVDRDVDIAAVDVQNRVNQVLGRLPASVRRLGVSVGKNSGSFVLATAMYSEDGKYSAEFLSNYVDVYVKNALKRLPGVSEIQIFGERKYAMRIWLDPLKLASRGLVPSDVVNALAEQNAEVAPGQIGSEPGPPDRVMQMGVRASGRLSSVSDFERVVVKIGKGGSFVRLSDVARVELGAEDYSSLIRFNGKPAIGFGIMQLPGANALDIARDVKAALKELKKEFPPGIEYSIAFDTTSTIDESINEVLKTLVEAILLVVLVMFVFLQSGRATLIPTLTIPVSLIGTFAFVKLLGFSINTLTLFGITLATGLVVDDAIVVVENVERHLRRKGSTPLVATSEATREVVPAVIATSIVLVAVFVPVAFYPGVTGRLYRQFALTIAASVSLSALSSLTLTPALSALLLRAHVGEAKGLLGAFERGFQRLNARFEQAVTWVLGKRLPTLVAYAFCAGGAYLLLSVVPQSFAPAEDKGWFMVGLSAPEGSSVNRTLEGVKRVEEVLQRTPEIESTFALTGWDFAGANPARGFFFINLKPLDERRGEAQSLDAVIERVRGELFAIDTANVFAFAPPSIDVGGSMGGLSFQVLDRTGGEMDRFSSVLGSFLDEAGKDPRLVGVYSGFSASEPQLKLELDRDKAKRLGLSLFDVRSSLEIAVGSAYVGDFDFNNRSYRVLVQAEGKARSTPANLDALYVRTQGQKLVTMGGLTKQSWLTAPSTIGHYNLFRSIDASGSPAPGTSSGEAIAAVEALAKKALPAGFAVTWTGLSEEELASRGKAGLIFGLCFLFVFLLLAALYESFVLPFVIMLSVPVAVFGAFSAVWARGLENDTFTQIGLVMLIALASKNAILVVEFAEQLRAQGASLVDAAIKASSVRLRPILMTSLAFIFGVLPLVFASGAGAGSRRSLGTTVAAGMLASTLLNGFFVPLLYVLILRARAALFRSRVPAAVAFIAIVLGASSAYAERVTFDQAVALAKKNHPSVLAAEADLLRAEAVLKRASAPALPTLSLNGTYTRLDNARTFEGVVVVPADAFTGNVLLNAPLLAPAQWENWSYASKTMKVSQLAFEDAMRRIALGVGRTYFAALTAEALVDVERRALAAAEKHFANARIRVQGGVGKPLDALRAEQQVQAATVRVTQAEAQLERAHEALGRAVGAQGRMEPDGAPTLAASASSAPSDESRIDERPDLRAMAARQAAAERHVTYAWTTFLPTVSAQLLFYHNNPAAFAQPPFGFQMQLVLSIPIYDGGVRYAELTQRRSERALSISDHKTLELGAKSEWRLAVSQLERSKRVLTAQRRGAALAAEALKVAESAYQLGTTTSLDVLDAETRARDAEAGVIMAENDLRQAELEWRFAVGTFP